MGYWAVFLWASGCRWTAGEVHTAEWHRSPMLTCLPVSFGSCQPWLQTTLDPSTTLSWIVLSKRKESMILSLLPVFEQINFSPVSFVWRGNKVTDLFPAESLFGGMSFRLCTARPFHFFPAVDWESPSLDTCSLKHPGDEMPQRRLD